MGQKKTLHREMQGLYKNISYWNRTSVDGMKTRCPNP